MRKMKKLIAMCLAAALGATMLASCGEKADDGKLSIAIGGFPNETDQARLETFNGYLAQMQEKYPDANIKTDTTNLSDSKTFLMKAAANALPTFYSTHFTEVKKNVNNGYAADITDVLKERGIYDALNPSLLDIIKGDDGKIYAFPDNAYMMGMVINKKLFREAGLVNEDGTAKIPDTYEELAQTAKIIKEKTGMAGYAICTTNGWGGWHFVNIAWSHGVNFMEQTEDGKWKATFDTPEAVAALQYVKDLKWKYDALPAEILVDGGTAHKLVGIGQAAMIFSTPLSGAISQYGMEVSDYAHAKLPKGPNGRYVQMGGGVYMFNPNATKEQIEAGFDWLDIMGTSKYQIDDQTAENLDKNYKTSLETSGVVFPTAGFSIWADPERTAKEEEIRGRYANVDKKDFASYMDTSDVILRPEDPVACQELYAVLDNCLQQVLTDENADCAEIIKKANSDFQKNHLDQL